jgi:hypothetical protein
MRREHPYPRASVRAVPFSDFPSQFRQPPGIVGERWPPTQVQYFTDYLTELECQSILIEGHYVDRDFVDDVALFYSRSLRAYPNYCRRLHFFKIPLHNGAWRRLFTASRASDESRSDATNALQRGYLGFCVVRPLPAYPVGRTVLGTLAPRGPDHATGLSGTRSYRVHLAGFTLEIEGLAFQQQDQGVSACATTALWTSLHRIADLESLQIPTPAFITQAACRYYLPGGRALPQEGLTIDQICEACRASGLAPIVLQGLDTAQVRSHLHALLQSGFPPLLALQPLGRNEGHAVSVVGFEARGFVPGSPTGPSVHDAGALVEKFFVHDDRLGPYACGLLEDIEVEIEVRSTKTKSKSIGTETVPALQLLKRDGSKFAIGVVKAIIVPMPAKIRLGVGRLRKLGFDIGKAIAMGVLGEMRGRLVIECRFEKSVDCLTDTFHDGLTTAGAYQLYCQTALSRYVARIVIADVTGPLFHVFLDATETEANPSVLAVVACDRVHEPALKWANSLCKKLGVTLIH